MMQTSRRSPATEFATMMQIVPVGSHARRAAAVAQFFSPVLRMFDAVGLALSSTLGLLRRGANG
jgi:hypothetical protein